MLSSNVWKQKASTWLRLPLFGGLMRLGIQILIPRHRIGVALVALDERNRVFMLNHVFHPQVPWGLPGGWLKRNEAPEIGVLRELREETGLTADIGPVIHIRKEKRPSHFSIAFLAKIHPGSPRLSGEIIEAEWFALDEIPQPQYRFVQEAITAALRMRRVMDDF